jgi:hypothetical protein
MVYVCTLKYGKKYNSTNVNQLYHSIAKSCSNFKFICLTDDATDINENIQVLTITEDFELKKHWNKLRFFDPNFIGANRDDDVVIMDIDQVFVGDPKKIIESPVNYGEVCFGSRWWSNQKIACVITGGLVKFKADGTHKHILERFLQSPDYWLTYFHSLSKAGKYPENIRLYAGEQNYLLRFLKQTHKIITWPRHYIVKLDEDEVFMEKQKALYKARVGGELVVDGKINPKTILVTFSGEHNDVFESSLINMV